MPAFPEITLSCERSVKTNAGLKNRLLVMQIYFLFCWEYRPASDIQD